jgi:DNA-binding HxlR family transcriptional regulator
MGGVEDSGSTDSVLPDGPSSGHTTAMRSYGQYCPVAKAAEIIGDRWTLMVIRELLFGPLGFNELARGLPGISRSILAQRLRHLQRLGIAERSGPEGGYRLTPVGEQLGTTVKSLGEWAARWVLQDPAQAELDPDLLVLWISRHVDMDALPDRRVVVDFDLRGPRPGRYWLVLERPAFVSICFEDPCLDERHYVYVQAETAALYQVYMGRLQVRDAVDDGAIDLSGQPELIRAFSRWFTWSHFAPIVRAASNQRASDPALR